MYVLALYQYLKSKGGAEKLQLEWLKRTKHVIDFYAQITDLSETFPEYKNYDVRPLLPGHFSFLYKKWLGRGLLLFPTAISCARFWNSDHDLTLIFTSGVMELVSLFAKLPNPVVFFVYTPLRPILPKEYEFNARYRFNLKYLWRFHPSKLIYELLEQMAWKRAYHVIFLSELSRKRAVGKSLIHPDFTSVIYPGADMPDAEWKEPRNYYLYFSRFAFLKRHEVLILAAAMLKKELRKRQEKFVFAGYVENKEYLDYLYKLINEYGVRDLIEFRFNLSEREKIELYERCKAFLFPAFEEDFGIAPLEAMWCGKYVIGCEGGWNERLKDCSVSLLKNRLNIVEQAKDFAERIRAFWEMEDEIIEDAKRKNRTAVERANLTWDAFSKQLDEKLEEIRADWRTFTV